MAGVGALALVCAGCGGEEERNAFDEISRLPPREELVEVLVGSFVIPVPIPREPEESGQDRTSPMLLEFELVAIVSPDKVSRVEYLMERHRGKIRDQVIRVCRSTPREDLLEPEWPTLKAHMLDAIQPLMGGLAIRRLATPSISRDEI